MSKYFIYTAVLTIMSSLIGNNVSASDSVYVQCPTGLGALCQGFKEHLSPRPVQTLSPDEEQPKGALLLSFQATERTASMLRGRLISYNTNRQTIMGPELELSTMDAEIPESELRSFAKTLLKLTPSALSE